MPHKAVLVLYNNPLLSGPLLGTLGSPRTTTYDHRRDEVVTPSIHPRRVLVVDDDRDIRESMVDALIDEGYSVQEAETGDQAIALIESSPPDLVLLDLMMPGVNGWQVLDVLERSPRLSLVPVFIVTAVNNVSGVRQGYPIFTKPFKLDRMIRTIRAFLHPDAGTAPPTRST
jgi:two-component system chemotaxis response regulator CheY